MDLVTLDLDGTLIETTVFEAAGRGLGLEEEIAFYDDLFFRGLLSLEATFLAEYDLFLDVPIPEIHDALRAGPWVDGIEQSVAALRSMGLDVWVVTDQPDWAVAYLSRFGLTDGVWTQTSWWEGQRVGAVERYAWDKRDGLEAKLEEADIRASEVCHVGNGGNDVPVFEAVGSSIAFNPSGPEVSQAADKVIRGSDLGPVSAGVEALMAER